MKNSRIIEVLKRLYSLLKIKNDTEFCDKYDIKPNTVSGWKRRESIPYELIDNIAQNEHLSLNYILFGQNDTQLQQLDNNCELYHLVNIPQKVSAGLGETYHDNDTTTFPVCKNLFKTPINQKDYKVVEVVGDSMEPDIKDGAIAIFQEVVSFEDDGLYIIRKADELYVKRVIRQLNGDFLIQSDNKKYPDLTLPKGSDENLYIIGRVKAILPRIET